MRTNPDDGRRTATTSTSGDTSAGHLKRLSDMDDFKVADGEPDIRGWDVKTTDGQKLGDVDDLLVDTGTMKVRYIEVELDKEFATDEDHRHALAPIGSARLDDDRDDVILPLRATDITGLPPYTRGNVTRDYEARLLERYGAAPARTGTNATTEDFYSSDHFNEARAFAGRRAKATPPATVNNDYLTRSK